jgi:cytochrome c-type biogenesis protein CcmH
MSRSLRRSLLAVLLAALLLAGPASAQEDQPATLTDLEDEVMCTICGTTLQLSESPQATRQRVFINELISEGATKQEVKDALVDEYGPEVLAVPSTEGFDLAAWVVPIAGVLAAFTLVGLAARRWRRRRAVDVADAPAPRDDPEGEERLRADLGRYEL